MGHEPDKFVRSGTFSVDGHNWSIRFYPDGYKGKDDSDFISVYLELMENGAKPVRASCEFSLIDQSTGLPSLVHTTELRMFSPTNSSRFAPQINMFKKRSEIEATGSGYLLHDRLLIDCAITVVTELRVSETKLCKKIEVPPSDIGQCLGKLLEASCDMIQHLLVAADRYAVDRLRLVCQSILFENINVNNVATMLALAYQHRCNLLQDACLEYISSSSNVMDAVAASQDFKSIKETCPSALADEFEKTMLRKT